MFIVTREFLFLIQPIHGRQKHFAPLELGHLGVRFYKYFAPPELAFYYPPRFYKHYAAARLNRINHQNVDER